MEEISNRLERVPLFAPLSRRQLAELATVVKRSHFSQGTTVVRQGDLGTTLFIVNSGEVVALAIDEKGEQMPPRFFQVGDSWGETSLLVGEPRDATMRVKEDAELLYIPKSDFDNLVAAHPDIWDSLAMRPDVHLKLSAPSFSWLGKGERVEWFGRKHWIMFVRNLAVPLGWWFIFVVILLLVGRSLSLGALAIGVLVITALISPWMLWLYIDWRDDFHIVTNQRVVHVERALFQYQSRDEAPLDKVQNISIRRSELGNSLGYADMSIATAGGRGGHVDFHWVPQPELVTDVINEQIRRFKMQQRMEEHQEIAQALEERLSPAQAKSWWEYQPPVKPVLKRDGLSLLARGRGCSRAITDSALYSFMVHPHLPRLGRIVEDGNIIWRKHWILLVQGIAVPSLLFLALLGVTLFEIYRLFLGRGGFSLLVLTLFPLMGAFFWLAWRYEDWRNDIYVVTPTQIIDIERTPFLFREARRQASLENIQDIRFEMPGFWASMLNRGNVLIQTAGQGQFTFDSVYDPSSVQREIFLRIEAFRERRQEAERRERERQLADWFTVYQQRQRQKGT